MVVENMIHLHMLVDHFTLCHGYPHSMFARQCAKKSFKASPANHYFNEEIYQRTIIVDVDF